MNLSNPLESLMKPAQANVLLAFIRVDERMTGRQVARIIGSSSPSGTRETLLQLVATGLLIAEPTPSGTFYALNRDHLLWPAVEQVADIWTRFTQLVASATQNAAPTGTSVMLYGSTARTRSTAASDIDLLVVFSDDAAISERDAFTGVLSDRVRLGTGNRVEIFDVTEKQLAAMVASEDPMIDSWRADAQLLAGPALRVGLSRVA